MSQPLHDDDDAPEQPIAYRVTRETRRHKSTDDIRTTPMSENSNSPLQKFSETMTQAEKDGALRDMAPERLAQFIRSLSETILSAFATPADAHAKSVVCLGHKLVDFGVASFSAQVSFKDSKELVESEYFDFSISARPSKPDDGRKEPELTAELADPKGIVAPRQKFQAIWEDNNAVLHLYSQFLKTFPEDEGKEAATLTAFALNILDYVSWRNAHEANTSFESMSDAAADKATNAKLRATGVDLKVIREEKVWTISSTPSMRQ